MDFHCSTTSKKIKTISVYYYNHIDIYMLEVEKFKHNPSYSCSYH